MLTFWLPVATSLHILIRRRQCTSIDFPMIYHILCDEPLGFLLVSAQTCMDLEHGSRIQPLPEKSCRELNLDMTLILCQPVLRFQHAA